MAAIELHDVSKAYPVQRPLGALLRRRAQSATVVALDRVSFSVAQSEVLGLLGPNGAGKTTLINILCTLLTPTSGSVRVGGHDLCTAPEHVRMLIGVVTSNERSFYWQLTGRQNLRFFAELYHVPPREIGARIDEFVRALDLADYVDRRFDGYSTGIRQRFAFARALLHRPSILLMDEPTKGLDPHASISLLQIIRERILKIWQPTIIITSHNLGEIEALCDRVAIMDRGRLLRIGTIDALARSIRSHEIYALEVANTNGAMLEGLGMLIGPDRLSIRKGTTSLLEIGLDGGNGSLSAVLRYILEHGGEIRRCEPIEVSLADVFHATVQRADAP